MRLSFNGADRGVTGSCHLVECAGRRVLVDCGLYQGSRELHEENAEPFGFDPAAVDVLLLTHAHLDHCGRLPLLVKRGFRGGIETTFLVHGDEKAMAAFARQLEGIRIEMPGLHQKFEI